MKRDRLLIVHGRYQPRVIQVEMTLLRGCQFYGESAYMKERGRKQGRHGEMLSPSAEVTETLCIVRRMVRPTVYDSMNDSHVGRNGRTTGSGKPKTSIFLYLEGIILADHCFAAL